MAFLYQPVLSAPKVFALSCYRPIEFAVRVNSVNLVERAICTVFQGIVAVAEFEKRPYNVAGNNYDFKFDIQAICRQTLPPTTFRGDAFPDLDTTGQSVSLTMSRQYNIKVTYLYRDANGILQLLGLSDISNTYSVCPVTRQNGEVLYLDEFYGIAFAPSFGKPLTRVPDQDFPAIGFYVQRLGENENAFMNILDTFTHMQVFVYVGLSVFATGYAILPTYINSLQYRTVGIGLVNLRQIAPAGWFGVPPTFPAGVSRLNIRFGYINMIGGFQSNSLTWQLKIEERCEPVRIHWLNRWAGVDAYTFSGAKDYEEIFDTDFAESPLPFYGGTAEPMKTFDIGGFQINPSVQTEISISEDVDFLTAEWLKELMTSPKRFVEKDGNYYPVIIKGTTTKYNTTKTEPFIRFELKIIFANDQFIQTI
jgi:hypothetical protein